MGGLRRASGQHDRFVECGDGTFELQSFLCFRPTQFSGWLCITRAHSSTMVRLLQSSGPQASADSPGCSAVFLIPCVAHLPAPPIMLPDVAFYLLDGVCCSVTAAMTVMTSAEESKLLLRLLRE